MRQRILLLLLISITAPSAFSQRRITVLAKDFTIYADTSIYAHLSTRLPDLLCSGILYHSSLQAYEPRDQDDSGAMSKLLGTLDNSNKSLEVQRKKIIDSLHVSYFVTGIAVFQKDAFSLSVSANNFKSPALQYQVKLRPLSEFQKVIDEASFNLNRLIDMDQAGDHTTRINITAFNVFFRKSAYAIPGNNLYAPDYYAIFLSQNLKNSDSAFYVIKPHLYSNDSTDLATDTSTSGNEINISGNVSFDRDSFTVRPFLYARQLDTIYLQPFADKVSDKDRLNASLVESIQTYLDDLVRNRNPDSNMLNDLSHYTQDDFKQSFIHALQSGNPKSALLYANEFLRKYPMQEEEGLLWKGMALYVTGNYTDALRYLDEVRRKNPANKDAVLTEGLTYLQMAKYNQSLVLLNKLSDSAYGPKRIPFYKGQCYFYLDSLQLARKEFLKQLSYPDDPKSDCYYYLGKIEEKKKHIKEAIPYYENAHHLDLSDPAYIQSLESVYGKYLLSYVNKEHPDEDETMDPLITKGIKGNYISEGSLLDLSYIIQTLERQKNNYNIQMLSQNTITVYKEYQRLKDTLTDKLWENEGILYIKLGETDSAIACMQKIIRTPVYKKGAGLIYLTIGELYILKSNFQQADSVFRSVETAIQTDSVSFFDEETVILLSFYQAELKIIQKKSYLAKQQKFIQIITSRKKDNLIVDWSFKDFYGWARSLGLKKQLKTLLFDNLCLISKFTKSPYCSQ